MEMVKASAIAILVIRGSGGAFGQPAAPRPEFEVASIKPAPPQAPGRVSTRMSADAGRLSYTNVSVSDVIAQAYRVQHNQISGPAWLDTERFDIAAKIPAGTAMDQIPQMFQALLADRFKLRLHREKKELPIYALVSRKNGPKLQHAESSGGLSIGYNPGRAHLSGNVTMAWFVDYPAVRLGRPVLDQTALEGAFAISLEWAPDSTEEPGSMAMDHPPGLPDGAAPGTAGPSLSTALQEQLGLKLVGTKGPVEILVIDYADKIPTEN